jgi:hypothetical protein
MLEAAIGFLGAYLARKAGGLAYRAADDVDAAINGKLNQLYELVKGQLLRLGKRGERSLRALEDRPDGDQPRKEVAEDLGEALADRPDDLAQLQMLIEELKQLDPTGVRLRGTARVGSLEDEAISVGLKVEGALQPGDSAEGDSTATSVKGKAKNVGLSYKPGQR